MKKKIFTLILLLGYSAFLVNAQQPQGVTNLGQPELPGLYTVGLFFKNTILSADDGTIWYSTSSYKAADTIAVESLIVQYNNGNWFVFHHNSNPILPRTINTISEKDNTIYIASPAGLYTFDGNVQEIESLQNQNIRALCTDNETVAAGTDNGLFILEGENWIQYNTNNSDLCFDTITSLEKTSDHRLWIGTKAGISVFDGSEWQTINSDNSDLTDDHILCLKADPNNTIWIGTQNAGPFKYAHESIQSIFELMPYPEPDSLNIKAIAVDAEGTVFIPYTTSLCNTSTRLLMINGNEYRLSENTIQKSNPLFAATENELYFSSDRDLKTLNKSEIDQVNSISRLDVNNVEVDFTAVGRMAWQPFMTDSYVFRIPKGSKTSTINTSSFWMGGLDEAGTLHLAGETYNIFGFDFWPGPVSTSEEIYEAEKHLWNKVWKLSKEDIEYHKQNWFKSDYVPHPDILSWPAHGNTEYGQMELIAPYMDIQSNGVYEPMTGDYPVIRGDQALFFIFNDDRKDHGESGGNKLGVEVHGMAYTFNQPESQALDHTVFINYQIINRSNKTYSDFHLAKFTDFDLGYIFDDFVGCDTLLNCFYAYNGFPTDGNGEPESYGENPPAQGVIFLSHTLSSFVFFDLILSPTGLPRTAIEYYNYMRAMWRDSTHILYGGTGHNSGQGTTGIPTNYMFSGDPVNGEGWSEVSESNPPDDRRGLGNVFVGDFAPNDRICFDLAYVYGRSDEGHLESVNSMKANIAAIRDFYAVNIDGNCTDLIPTSTIEIGGESQSPKLFPNPATNILYVSFAEKEKVTATIFNSLGQLVRQIDTQGSELQLDLSKLENGLYILKLQTFDRSYSYKFVKQE
ncbi:MAG: T9SS type A sorting domain-containing protein [Bacteroidetes bacterium]|jgi:hypothetical protein|nr:T9SS type A sorting domain-containing protein [Bacteroidota bacterium]